MTDTLLETTIADWRISDQCTEDLTPKQMLEFCNVDGMKRLVSIEVDQGNVTVGAYRDADGDQDAKFHITDAAVFAQAGRNFPGSFDLVSFNEDETTISRDTIPAGLV
jgi:hypothetical protein